MEIESPVAKRIATNAAGMDILRLAVKLFGAVQMATGFVLPYYGLIKGTVAWDLASKTYGGCLTASVTGTISTLLVIANWYRPLRSWAAILWGLCCIFLGAAAYGHEPVLVLNYCFVYPVLATILAGVSARRG